MLAEAFGLPGPEQVIFTSNCTESLNIALRGTLFEGDEVLVSHSEHNAVMRVLKGFEQQGLLKVVPLEPDSRGLLSAEGLRAAITPKTALCVICHASNVTGVVQPVAVLSPVLKAHGIPLLVDAPDRRGAGCVPAAWGRTWWPCPGIRACWDPRHRGAAAGPGHGPQAPDDRGTGSQSEHAAALPSDRYESGTANLPGIAGLLVGPGSPSGIGRRSSL